jgi:hypothetical protein
LRTAANGAVVGFALGGHTWSLTRDDSGVSTAKRDGSPVTLAALPTARMPVTSGSSWTNGGLIFAKLQGVPAASVAEGGHVRMVATGTPTFEAIATPAPSDDVVVEGQLVVDGEAGGIAVRALSGKDRLQGIALVLHPEQGKAFLQSLTATAETDLGPAVAITAGPVHRIRLTIKRDAVEAVIDARSIKAQVGAPFEHGDVALLGRRGAQVEITGLHVRKP